MVEENYLEKRWDRSPGELKPGGLETLGLKPMKGGRRT
jgi:hypothetical protein